VVYPLTPSLSFLFTGVFDHWISLQRHPRGPAVRAERATRCVRQFAERRNARPTAAVPTATAARRQRSRKAGHVRLPVAVRVHGQKLVGIHLRYGRLARACRRMCMNAAASSGLYCFTYTLTDGAFQTPPYLIRVN